MSLPNFERRPRLPGDITARLESFARCLANAVDGDPRRAVVAEVRLGRAPGQTAWFPDLISPT